MDPLEGILWVFRWSADGYTQVVNLETEDVPAGELVRVEPFDAASLDLTDIFQR